MYNIIMDTRIIESRKNIIIRMALTARNQFNWTINNVNFVPDEVIVKLVNYVSTGTEAQVSGIYTDLVSDVICSFFDGIQTSPDIRFPLRKPISGQYSFQLVTPDGDLLNRSGNLWIHLEFVKYRTDLPDKKIF